MSRLTSSYLFPPYFPHFPWRTSSLHPTFPLRQPRRFAHLSLPMWVGPQRMGSKGIHRWRSLLVPFYPSFEWVWIPRGDVSRFFVVRPWPSPPRTTRVATHTREHRSSSGGRGGGGGGGEPREGGRRGGRSTVDATRASGRGTRGSARTRDKNQGREKSGRRTKHQVWEQEDGGRSGSKRASEVRTASKTRKRGTSHDVDAMTRGGREGEERSTRTTVRKQRRRENGATGNTAKNNCVGMKSNEKYARVRPRRPCGERTDPCVGTESLTFECVPRPLRRPRIERNASPCPRVDARRTVSCGRRWIREPSKSSP